MTANRYYSIGTRKEAIAKVFLTEGTGKLIIFTGNVKNRKQQDPKLYFCSQFLIDKLLQPITLLNRQDKWDINVVVTGGGKSAQSEAIRLALAKALSTTNTAFKPILKSQKLITQDKRIKERKKIGKRGARSSPQFTKR